MRLHRVLPTLFLAASLHCRAGVIDVTTGLDQFGEDSAKCSLREAIQAARTDTAFGGCAAGTVADVITLGESYSGYVLTREGANEDANATGDLDVTGSGTIAIIGIGSQQSVISGKGIDRVFDVNMSTTGTFILNKVTVTGGDAGIGVGGAGVCAPRHRTDHQDPPDAQLGGARWRRVRVLEWPGNRDYAKRDHAQRGDATGRRHFKRGRADADELHRRRKRRAGSRRNRL